MAARPALPSLLLLLLLLVISAVDLVSSDIAPSPVPGGPVRAPAPPTSSPASPPVPSPSSPAPAMGPSAPSPIFSPGSSASPPAPPVAPASSPSPTPTPSPAPTPTPTPGPSVVNEAVADGKKSDEQAVAGDSSGGMSGRKKAGIAVGVLAAAAVVGLGALVYKKRRDNIQRSRYGYATRRDML